MHRGKIPNSANSSIILQKISLYSKNKNFYLKDIEVYLKFPNNNDELKCTLWTWRNMVFTFDEHGRKVHKKLNIDTKEYLLHLTVLPKDQSVVGYLSFTHDHLKDEMYDYIRYVFVDFDGNRKELILSKDKMSANTELFDDKIWIPTDGYSNEAQGLGSTQDLTENSAQQKNRNDS
jgi:hypothetical protein